MRFKDKDIGQLPRHSSYMIVNWKYLALRHRKICICVSFNNFLTFNEYLQNNQPEKNTKNMIVEPKLVMLLLLPNTFNVHSTFPYYLVETRSHRFGAAGTNQPTHGFTTTRLWPRANQLSLSCCVTNLYPVLTKIPAHVSVFKPNLVKNNQMNFESVAWDQHSVTLFFSCLMKMQKPPVLWTFESRRSRNRRWETKNYFSYITNANLVWKAVGLLQWHVLIFLFPLLFIYLFLAGRRAPGDRGANGHVGPRPVPAWCGQVSFQGHSGWEGRSWQCPERDRGGGGVQIH